MSNTPAHKIRIANLQAVIWPNSGQNGSWYSVNLSRSFKADEDWREADRVAQ